MVRLLKMPRLGLTMTEGTVVAWHKEVNDYVKKGEALADIESDKSVVTYESPEEGYLLVILAKTGETVECQANIAAIGEKGEAYETAAEQVAEAVAGVTVPVPEPVPTEIKTVVAAETGKIFASPAAKRVAKENSVDLSLLRISQSKVRIEKADVLNYLSDMKAGSVKMTPLAKKIADAEGIDPVLLNKKQGERIYSSDLEQTSAVPATKHITGEDRAIPVAGMRKVIAARMKESLDTAAHVSLTTEVDMINAVRLRERMLSIVKDTYNIKLSLNDIIVKCVAVTLAKHPRINSVFTGSHVIEKKNINIGVAVALEEGLVVPVIRDCNRKSIGEIAAESKQLSDKARNKGLSKEEMSEGTFTVSNLGMFGITQFSSIINQPESAILSVAQVVKRPIVTDTDDIIIRPMMNLTVNFDHRPIDGATAAKFLKDLKSLLEEPAGLLL